MQATLTHTLWAEWLWLERWQGRSPMELFTPEEFPSASEFRSRWSPVQGAQEAFLAALAPDDLQRVLHYTNRNGEVSPGQVTNMLRLLGAQPATTDFLEFLGRKGNGRVSVKITRRSNRG